MQRNSVCKNEVDYYTMEDMIDIETSDLVFVKLNNNIFCMELDSFKNMIRFSREQKRRGTRNEHYNQYIHREWYYPILAAPVTYITEKNYNKINSNINNTTDRYYKLVHRKKTKFIRDEIIHDVYELVPANFSVDENGNNLIQSRRGRGRRSISNFPPLPPPPSSRRSPSPRRSPLIAPIQQRNYTVVQLKQICKDKGIRGYSKMKKSELIRHCQVNNMSSSTLTVKELRRICKDNGIRGYSKMKKNELLNNCIPRV